MEDPWGDPWATDVSVKIDLPAPPREAYFASDRVHSPRRTNPDAASPWHDDDDTWAGWTNARSGRESPAWGSRSPALKPSAAVPERRASPDPWAAAAPPEPVQDNERADQNQTAAGTAGLDIHVEDSASLSQAELSPTRPSDRLTASFDHSGQDIWGKEQASTADGRATASTPEDPHGLEPADTGSRCAAHVETEGRPVAGRQPSKVQELVEMFDVMARRSTSPAGTAVPENASDEVFQSHPTQLPIEDEQGAAEACVEIKLDSTAVPDDPPARTPPYEKKDAPQIPFPIDLSHLDDLFPPGPSPPPESNSRSEGIGSETFTSVSERKVWYRISRFGSMRRHDEGDQDDYVRVGWAKSRVRERTLEVIRRWMEEDSIGGRVALGRRLGSGAGNVFNWDSPGEPVEIGELLKKKPAAYQSRPPSAPVSQEYDCAAARESRSGDIASTIPASQPSTGSS
ncbi:hypothetical protein CDD83_1626 [Cordyceps sp. RAO-2017]|nr:hypothetical protein CDD83_1626 [Cordyceps sp. RAO-2017]